MDDPNQSGWSEERKAWWRIERLLQSEVILLQQILRRLPAAPQYRPTIGVVVVAGVPDKT